MPRKKNAKAARPSNVVAREVKFGPTETPNFMKPSGRWAMIFMDDELTEVPLAATAFQVPFIEMDESELQAHIDELHAMAQNAHSQCSDSQVVVSRGSGRWEGKIAIHVEGSVSG